MAVDNFRIEYFNIINIAKQNDLSNLGNQLNDPATGAKAYWKVLNKLLKKVIYQLFPPPPRPPPILHNNKFITSFAEKSNCCNKYFVNQCKILINDNALPPFHLFTDKQIIVIDYSLEDLKNTIHALNLKISHGPDNISVCMLHICGDPILAPLD